MMLTFILKYLKVNMKKNKNETSVYKILYLRIKELSEKWKKPIQNWSKIQSQLIELFGDRYTKYLEI